MVEGDGEVHLKSHLASSFAASHLQDFLENRIHPFDLEAHENLILIFPKRYIKNIKAVKSRIITQWNLNSRTEFVLEGYLKTKSFSPH